MAKGKLILICHSGGEFVTNDDATMIYNGGEANAVNVTCETLFNDLKLQLAEACNFDQKTVTIKYFLPKNKKTLIFVKNDKDVRRMIDFYDDAYTAEVFVTGTPGFEDIAINMQSNKKNEVLNLDNVGKKIEEPVKRDRLLTKKDDKVPASPPVKRTRRATTAAATTAVAFDDNQDVGTDMSDSGKSDGSAHETSSSDFSDYVCEKEDSDYGSDYKPKRSLVQRKRNSQSEINIDVESSPPETVKKRRCTPSWKFGPNGRLTIVSFADEDSVGPKSPGKSEKAENSGGRSSLGKSSRSVAKDDCTLPETVDDYALPETVDDSWKLAITGVGQEFASVNEFRAALKKYAIANRFGYRLRKNDTIRAIGECTAEGCTWKISAKWVPTFQSFMIKKLNNIHTCDKDSRISAHPARNWLVGTIKDKLRESPYLKPKEIANGLLQDFGVELNYTRVRRGIGDARELLHGSPIDSYNKLPWFCENLVKTNPGSITNLVISNKNRFKSLFISFQASINGFQKGCRPLIFLEAASLKSRYGEILFTANAIDGNDGFFTVAFAIVDIEDDDNWHWFLEQLKASILNSRPITFVIDRDKNLKNSVHAVFENAHVGYSIYHLLASFKRNMKGPFHGDGQVHLLAAAHAVHLAGFKKSTEHIKLISSKAYDWVMESEPEHWATSSFKGEQYNHIIEDVGDSHVKLMEDNRYLPILSKIDALIRTMIDQILDAKLNASKWSTQLTASKQKELEEEEAKARGLKVLISSDTLFEVRESHMTFAVYHVVNVSDQSCTCTRWKVRGLPCRHALAVFSLTGKNPYDFCSSYFTADAYHLTYAESIHPIPIEQPLRNPKEKPQKPKGGKEECEMEDGNKETGEIREKEDNSKEETDRDKTRVEVGENMEVQKDENIKEGNDKVKGSNVDPEKEAGCKLDVDKVEGVNVDVGKDKDINVHAGKDQGIIDVEELEDEGINENVAKDEVGNVDAEKGGGDVVAEKEVSNPDAEKEDGKIGKLGEEHEDTYVLVLPPIPAKSSSSFGKK